LIIDLTEYLERRRRTAEARAMQIATVFRHGGRVARHGAAGVQARRSAGPARWSSVLPVLPALELATLYSEASLI
jgi:hypothetical protein